MKTLAFATAAQLILWNTELRGQLSDGYWENARNAGGTPHWRPWCDAKAVVDPANPGRDFFAAREAYNFTAPDLLDVVGDRMCYRLALLEQQPDAVARLDGGRSHSLPESDTDWEECVGEKYFDERRARWTAAGLTKLTALPPTRRELKKILTEMKKVIKTRRA